MKLVYPIILYPMEEHEGGYTVEVPDLPAASPRGMISPTRWICA